MKAAIVFVPGKTPVYGDFREPEPGGGEVTVNVTASALSNLAKGRAAGTHYSSTPDVPFVVGVDGVGRLDDGRRVYFVLPKPPLGAMSERTAVNSDQCIELPDELDDVTAAAIANPGMSAWAALSYSPWDEHTSRRRADLRAARDHRIPPYRCSHSRTRTLIRDARSAGALK